MKSGVGLRLGLAQPADVSRVEIDTQEGGWSAAIYVADSPGDSLAAWGSPVGSVEDAGASASIELDGAPSGSAVLVWFTRLPTSGRVAVDEVRVA